MTDPTTNSVNIRILERDYQFSTPPEEEDRLREASQLLNQRMKEIRNSGRVVGTERIAVMAALNLAYELMHNAPLTQDNGDTQKISALTTKIEEALASDSQMELT
ncbi:cell division protein ZapA [Pleionea sp. CnH1-48]|uniref:cell division protein ZapA n=1 Tax=Pleionea sp. CnH1-48 TaxID=2954494 RepID=UPI002096BFF0|nr:cell division protein ZapA [Pleionea sp. CnH1-48]